MCFDSDICSVSINFKRSFWGSEFEVVFKDNVVTASTQARHNITQYGIRKTKTVIVYLLSNIFYNVCISFKKSTETINGFYIRIGNCDTWNEMKINFDGDIQFHWKMLRVPLQRTRR